MPQQTHSTFQPRKFFRLAGLGTMLILCVIGVLYALFFGVAALTDFMAGHGCAVTDNLNNTGGCNMYRLGLGQPAASLWVFGGPLIIGWFLYSISMTVDWLVDLSVRW